MKHVHVLSVLMTLLLALAGCASGPQFKAEGVDKELQPDKVSGAPGAESAGKRVIWGGVVIASDNLENTTQLEVLGYPLDGVQEPQTDEGPVGRFLVVKQGYLETADFAPGRHITVIGKITGVRQGKIGESAYTYPVVEPERIHLWPRATPTTATEPRFHFGLGVVVGD